MHNKVFVTIHVPTIDKTYDVFIPANKTFSEIIILISKVISELSGVPIGETNHALCDKSNGNIYDLSKTIKESGIINGTKLVFI